MGETPEKEESLAALLKEMRDDMKESKISMQEMRKDMREVKDDMKESKESIKVLNDKIDTIETRQRDNETKTVNEIATIRNEIQVNNSNLQETIQTNLLSQIKPEMAKLQEDFVKNDLHKVVEELLSKKKADPGNT